jgi:tetratricopeptide (TPR) repeat protein
MQGPPRLGYTSDRDGAFLTDLKCFARTWLTPAVGVPISTSVKMARTMSSEEYQALGRQHYKEKQYEKAVNAFTNAIEASTNPTTKLFDYRAASYDKLNDYNSALKDGREMIRLDKKDVKVGIAFPCTYHYCDLRMGRAICGLQARFKKWKGLTRLLISTSMV